MLKNYKILVTTLVVMGTVNVIWSDDKTDSKPVASANKKAAPSKVAVVDTQKIMGSTEQGKDMIKKAEEEFQVRLVALQKQKEDFAKKAQAANAASDRDAMKSLAKLQKDLEIEERDLEGFSQQLQAELQMAIAQKVEEAIAAVRKEQGWDIIFPKFFDSNKEFDISDDVIKHMNQAYKKQKAAEKFKKDDKKAQEDKTRPAITAKA